MSKKQSTKSMERKSIKQRITGISKKKIVSMAILAVAVIAIIIAIVINQVNTQNLKRNESATNGDKSAQALTKNETEETQNDDSNGIALYAADTTDTSEQKGAKAVWAQGLRGDAGDGIEAVAECKDGGYIVGGDFYSYSIDLGNGVYLKNHNQDSTTFADGMIIKYSSSGEIEWTKVIGGTSDDHIWSVATCKDGGYIIGGDTCNSNIDSEDNVSVTFKGGYDGILIKCNSEGKIEWAKSIGGSKTDSIQSVAECSDGGYIVGGYFYSSSINLENGVSLTNKNSNSSDGMIVKYSASGEVEWAKKIGGTSTDEILSVAECRNGGYIVGGSFRSSSINLGNGINLKNKGATDGMIIKYSSNGEIEYAKAIGETGYELIRSVTKCSDGGYIVGGSFGSSSIDLGNGISLSITNGTDGMLIKYNSSGEVEWAKGGIGDAISVQECSDGGYIVGGACNYGELNLGNGVSVSVTSYTSPNGVVIKYNSSGEAEWAKVIAKDYDTIYVKSVAETRNGGYIVGGSYTSSGGIDLGNDVSLSNTYEMDGMVIKYEDLVKRSSVLVHHYLKDTTTSLSDDVTINGKVGDAYSASPATDIPEYYELVATPSNQAGTMTEDQIVVTYYYQLKSYPYTVNYLEKDTGTVLHAPKTGTGVYGSTVSSANEKISIDGYNFNSVDKDSLTIGTSGNVLNLYYTKRTDLSLTVNYLEKSTNKVIIEPKVVTGLAFGEEVNLRPYLNIGRQIDGYNYDSVDTLSPYVIGTGDNVVNVYLTKRTDLSYTVNYFEKGTTTAIKTAKVKSGMTFQATVTSASEKIDIDGYNYDSASAANITIGTGSNVLNLYYTKRTDLSYTVNYLEKGSNAKLKTSKTVSNITFGSTVKAANEKVAIDGYNYDSVSADTITIGTGSNVINIYYTKRTDLTYTINYLEKDTNKVIKTAKTANKITYGTVIKASDEVAQIDGYDYNSADKTSITVGTGANVINLYYTKVTGLSYTVNYLEKGTTNAVSPAKTVGKQTFATVIKSSDEIITIDGYKYDSADKTTLTIGTGSNVINLYYTKRTDLNYKVNYLEKTTNKILHTQKLQTNVTFKTVITSANEVIAINGYNYASADKTSITVGTGENVINLYYTKRTDLSYTVNYLEKDTNKVIHTVKTQGGKTFEDIVKSADEKIAIDGSK